MWPMIALGAIQAGAQIYSGYKQKESAEYNANIMREQGEFARRQAYDQASNVNKQGNSFIGSQKAGIASSGVKSTSGSPLAALRESERNLQQDVSRTMQAGDHAYQSSLSQANSLEQQGKDAFTASLIGGATSFAGTLASNINIPKSAPSTDLSKTQRTAINASDVNYADFSMPNQYGREQYGGMGVFQQPPNKAKPKTWQDKQGPVWGY